MHQCINETDESRLRVPGDKEYNKSTWREGSLRLLREESQVVQGSNLGLPSLQEAYYTPCYQAPRVQCPFELEQSSVQRFWMVIFVG